jgi:hypothetical protein
LYHEIKKKRKKERIDKSAIIHANRGDLRQNEKTGKWRMFGGGHGQTNIRELKKYKIEHIINQTYKNGVRIGDVPNHKKSKKRKGSNQTWFPRIWTAGKIKRAGGKIINAIPYKLPDGRPTYGKYKNVKVGVIRTYGRVSTIFPDKSQPLGIRKQRIKRLS